MPNGASPQYRGVAVNDFPYQLVRASNELGTMFDVARVLEVQPSLVYRWIAGVDLPGKERIEELNARLEPLLLTA